MSFSLIIIFLLLTLSVAESDSGSDTRFLPLPPLSYCKFLPPPPGTQEGVINSSIACQVIDELYSKYIKLEDYNNPILKIRDMMFLDIFVNFVELATTNKNNPGVDPDFIDTKILFGYIGLPDYRKYTTIKKVEANKYIYLIDYKGKKDLAIILTEIENRIDTFRYAEAKQILNQTWEIYSSN